MFLCPLKKLNYLKFYHKENPRPRYYHWWSLLNIKERNDFTDSFRKYRRQHFQTSFSSYTHPDTKSWQGLGKKKYYRQIYLERWILTILSNQIQQYKMCIIPTGVYVRNARLVLPLKISVIGIWVAITSILTEWRDRTIWSSQSIHEKYFDNYPLLTNENSTNTSLLKDTYKKSASNILLNGEILVAPPSLGTRHKASVLHTSA